MSWGAALRLFMSIGPACCLRSGPKGGSGWDELGAMGTCSKSFYPKPNLDCGAVFIVGKVGDIVCIQGKYPLLKYVHVRMGGTLWSF